MHTSARRAIIMPALWHSSLFHLESIRDESISIPGSKVRAQEMMDHLDRLDYAFLSFSVVGFLFCVIAISRQMPYRQTGHHHASSRSGARCRIGKQATTMDENVHRFGVSAVDELNGHRRGQRQSRKDFVLLMIGLIILLVLLYVQIVLVATL